MKPTVYYNRESLGLPLGLENRQVTVVALNHPELGYMSVTTSTVLSSDPDTGVFETRNSVYRPGRFFAVTGRMIGDDEDTGEVVVAGDRDEAIAAFVEIMWERETSGWTPEEAKEAREVAEANGEGVVVNSIFASDAPIEEVA